MERQAFPTAIPDKFENGNYILLGFTAENILQSSNVDLER